MPIKRYAIIDVSAEPQAVVDIIDLVDNPGADDHETLVVTEGFHAVLSPSAHLGWIWDRRNLKRTTGVKVTITHYAAAGGIDALPKLWA